MRKFYLISAVLVGIFCVTVSGEVELQRPRDVGLIGQANPALVGINQVYVIIEPSDAGQSKDGLVWEDLQKEVEQKLKNAGIAISPGVHLGKGIRAHDIPELRVRMEMLKFVDSRLYVFRLQVSLATKVSLPEKKVSFKANVWDGSPVIQAVSIRSMPAKVTYAALDQVEAFISAWVAANPEAERSADANDAAVVTKERAQSVVRPVTAEYKYIASKNSKVFHSLGCSSARRIKPGNIVSYSIRAEAVKAGKRPCMRCKP